MKKLSLLKAFARNLIEGKSMLNYDLNIKPNQTADGKILNVNHLREEIKEIKKCTLYVNLKYGCEFDTDSDYVKLLEDRIEVLELLDKIDSKLCHSIFDNARKDETNALLGLRHVLLQNNAELCTGVAKSLLQGGFVPSSLNGIEPELQETEREKLEQLYFQDKTLLHPSQVAPYLEVSNPTL